jgi:hypothetical protein
MANKFTPPASFTHNGKLYVFQYDKNRNKKKELLSEVCYYYKIDGKGNALPFVKSQIIWMQKNK